jgi:hypothetical protein
MNRYDELKKIKGTPIEEIASAIRDEYAFKQIIADIEAMAADADYMNAVGKEGRRRVHEILDAVRNAHRPVT